MLMPPPDTTIIDELATLLFARIPGPLTTEEITAYIATLITRWAIRRGWLPRPEVRVRIAGPPGQHPRVGYFDLIVRRGSSGPDLAIEIDSTDKQWSLGKLRHAAAKGMVAIWVRWGDEARAGVHDEVDVIQLPQTRRSAQRWRGTDQLALW